MHQNFPCPKIEYHVVRSTSFIALAFAYLSFFQRIPERGKTSLRHQLRGIAHPTRERHLHFKYRASEILPSITRKRSDEHRMSSLCINFTCHLCRRIKFSIFEESLQLVHDHYHLSLSSPNRPRALQITPTYQPSPILNYHLVPI